MGSRVDGSRVDGIKGRWIKGRWIKGRWDPSAESDSKSEQNNHCMDLDH
jgi:hypothetical protein